MTEHRPVEELTEVPEPGPGRPTPPIGIAGGADGATAHLADGDATVPGELLAELAEICPVSTTAGDRAEASRDWWPLAMCWATDGRVPGVAAAVVTPSNADEVAGVLAACNAAGVPVTAAGGRSGVCGSSVPVHGGILLDTCGLAGINSVDETSLVLDVAPGTFGDHLEHTLRTEHGLTLGHWPQSIALSTVGGWLACRGAGQLSNRYGKIEDMVLGLDVVLADGRRISTGGNARQATGPDLTQLFVGSEGTLGVITGSRLRLHPAPGHERRAAWGFASFSEGLDACRRVFQRGATPAVMRLYDPIESARNYGTEDIAVLLVLDEGDLGMVNATMEIVAEECATAQHLDASLVGKWLSHRNEVSALEKLISRGLVVDTMEVTGPWSALDDIHRSTVEAIGAVESTLAVSAHQSHAYTDGACLYFTFAGQTEPERREDYYRRVWDAGTLAVIERGGSLSHHHGVGLNRGRFMRQALGGAFDVLETVKGALDPKGILNPGKLGLDSPFGPAPFGAAPGDGP